MIILFNDSPQYPNRSLGVYRIATVLRRYGLEVEVIDYLSKWEKGGDLIFNYLDKIENVEWWGFSTKFKFVFQKLRKDQAPGESSFVEGVITQASAKFENDLIKYIKKRKGSIVVGGPTADTIKFSIGPSVIDILCEGYADNGVIAIHNHIVNSTELTHTVFNGMKVVDCDKDYADINLSQIDTEYDYTDFIEEGEVFPIELSRGCIFQCAFCSFGHLGKKPGTYIRDKDSIKKDIVDRYEKFGSTKFLFLDDTFNDSVEKMQLVKEIREESNIPFEFWSYARLDLLRAKPEMVDLIDDIGWTSFTFGIETLNKQSGSSVGKGADPEKLKQFLLDLRDRYPTHKFQINLIVGLPHDTEESIRETVQWFLDNPHIASNLRIRELNIHIPTIKKYSSKISKDPVAYGYQIDPPKSPNAIMYNWKTNNLSAERAILLSHEMQKLINEGIHNSNPATAPSSMQENMLSINEDGSVVNERSATRVRNYITAKRRYRGLI
jgi:radical SAM superfamily enzyme YgiQ (UPF0313 family)